MGRWEVEVRDRTGIGSGDPLFLHILSLGKRMGLSPLDHELLSVGTISEPPAPYRRTRPEKRLSLVAGNGRAHS